MINKSDNERTILGLLRLMGWRKDGDRDLTNEEAEMIIEVAATQPVPAGERAHLRERVMNQP